MDRREFISWIGVGGLAASLPVVLAACQSGTDTAETEPAEADPTAAAPSGGGSETVGTLADLEPDGFLLNKSASIGPVLVIARPDNPTAVEAVNPTCPHAGCTVSWEADTGEMICPCHGSRFAADGSLVQGPASEGLERYEVSLEGENIVVSLS